MSRSSPQAFKPIGTVNLALSTTTGAVALTTYGSIDNAQFSERTVRLVNPDASIRMYVNTGDSTVEAAAATSTPLLPGQTIILALGTHTHVAALSASGTPTIFCTAGYGGV